MDTLVQALLIILLAGGLSLLSHWARENRAAEMSLLVILLFFSFLVVALGVLVALVGLAARTPTLLLPTELFAISAPVLVLAGLVGFALCIPPLRKIMGQHHATVGYDAGLAFESFATRDRSSGSWLSDPPTFFALWMFVIVLASNVVGLLIFALAPETLGSALASTGRLSPMIIVLGQLPFVVTALCGVGLGVRRNLRDTLARLGYGPITLSQLGGVGLFVVGAILLSFAANALFATLQPGLFERVGEVYENIFSSEGLSPISAVLFAFFVGVGAALGEETLFRGALQPALGIMLVSTLFASMHIQYGPSLLLGYVFILSIGLGLVRRHINTTASFLAHASYNTLGVLLAHFFGV